MLYYDITMTQTLPRWTYLVMAIGVFLFQTLDGVDGKQARKTNSSSPLGQLFDHGLDGISWTVISMNVVSLLGLGLSTNAILCMLGSWGPLYLTTLLEYYTGVFEYDVGNIDSTTGLLVIIALNLFPFIFGTHFYDIRVKDVFPSLSSYISENLEMRDLAMLFIIYVGILYSIFILFSLFKNVKGVKTRLI